MIANAKALLAAIGCAFAMLLTAPVAAKDDVPFTYTVKKGDTLYGLSERYMVGQHATDRVARLNRIRDPHHIPVGKVLRIPRELVRFTTVRLSVRNTSGLTKIEGQRSVKGMSLREEDVVSTSANGFITFVSDRGGLVSLPSNTTARLKRARQYVLGNTLDVDFEITSGRGSVKAPKLKQQERFRVRTPLAVTAVRGTEYRVGYDATTEISVAEVTEGAVAVEAGDQTGLAEAGFGVAMAASGVGDLEVLLPQPEIIEGSAVQTDERLNFTVTPLDGAALYRTQIATDATFLEVIDEQIGRAGSTEFDGLADGRYNVRSRAVSETGIEGLSGESYSFRRKRLGVTASAEPSPLAYGFKFAWESIGAGESSFAFQLWNQADARRLVVDEVGVSTGGLIITELEPGTYLWRVATTQVDQGDFLKIWSPEQRLIVSE